MPPVFFLSLSSMLTVYNKVNVLLFWGLLSNLSGRDGRHGVIPIKQNSCMNVFVLAVLGENMICLVFGWLDVPKRQFYTFGYFMLRYQ